MITAADALAYCLAQPGADRLDCRDAVSAQLVGGVYCDGDVLAVAGQPKRCIPTSALERKRAAAAKSPLPAHASTSSSAASTFYAQHRTLLLLAGAAALAGAAYFLLRDKPRSSRSNPSSVRLVRSQGKLGPWWKVNPRDLPNLAGESGRYVTLETVGFGKYVVVDSYADAADAQGDGAWSGWALVDRDTGDVIDRRR